jgi:protein CpxP
MNTSSKYKMLTRSVILLIIVNVAMLSTIWIMDHRQPAPMGYPADYLGRELQFSNEQQTQLLALADAHHRKADSIKLEIKDSRDSLFVLIRMAQVDESIKKELSENIGRNLARLDLLTFEHFRQVRAICSPEQQQKFDTILQDVIQMIGSAPPNRKHQPGPPRNDDRMSPPDDERGDRKPPPEN